MATARKILNRLKAVGSIRTVTKTMEMVASTRFRRAHVQAVAARPYTGRLADLVGDVVARCKTSQLDHPLLDEHEDIRREVLLVITSNTGLCGAYNSSVLSVALARREQLVEAGYEVLLRVVGRRGRQALRFRDVAVEKAVEGFDHDPPYADVSAMADGLMSEFVNAKIGGLEVAYMQYLPSGRQSAVIAQVLPMSYAAPPPVTPGITPQPYEFLPDPPTILARLLPATMRLRLYQCFLDAAVTEQLSRVRAMGSARENADEMLHDLTVRYNRRRQAQITTELAEILGGSVGGE